MREITFTIDPTTGELTVHVQGIAGPGCEDVAALVTELVSGPDRNWNTPEYYLRPQVRRQIRPQSRR